MKIIKGLLYFIAGLFVLLCIFIVVCAFRPELSERVGGFLFPGNGRGMTAEVNGGQPDGEIGVYFVEDYGDDEESSGRQDEEKEGASGRQDEEAGKASGQPDDGKSAGKEPGMNDGVASDYVAPDRAEIVMPKAVEGKSGYRQIEEQREQVDDIAAREIQDRLDTGNTGDGLEFDPLYYPYYAMQNEKGRHLYRQIYANANALYQEFAPVESVTAGELKNIFSAVYNDHPELFWMETAFAGKFVRNGECVEIDLKFNRTAQDLDTAKALFEENAGQILSGAQNLANDYEKEKFVHDALIERISYQMSAEMNQSAYSALVNGQTVCAGYARAFQYLMQQLGVPCYYCTGYAGENHAWNIIRLDDGYYNVDTTWDDTGDGTYDYFNKTDADYADSHLRQEMSVYLPACDGQAYRGLEPESSGLRSLEEAGMAEEQVITDMPGYYADCYEQILRNGIGSYTFYNVIEGEELFQTWYREHQTENYKEAYMRGALAEIGASSCEMTLEAEELQGGRYLISHTATVR